MPELTISIGGREFTVACQEGEENFLKMAAQMLDDEAQVVVDQMGRMPEARMLLMSGLMLADATEAPFAEAIAYAALFNQHYEGFSEGRISSAGLVYYGSLTFTFLWLATKVNEGRRWE